MKKDKSKKEEIQQKLIKDIQDIAKRYRTEFGEDAGYITRDYYRKYGKYKITDITNYFKDFTEARNEALKEDDIDLDSLGLQKKLIQLEEKNRELEKEKRELLKRSIDEDDLLALYKESLNNIIELKINNKEIILRGDEDRVALLQLSDWHIGEIVLSESVNNVNEYNEKICLERLDTVFNIFVTYCKKFNITKCHILLNGDLLSGGIHNELIRNMWCNEVQQIFFAQKYLIQKLEYISQFFNKISIDIIVGNHPRILQGKPYFKEKISMNFEYILGKNLQMYFNLLTEQNKNNKIFIEVPESPFSIVDINGAKFLETHGDILIGSGTGGFAGIPFYAICQSASKLYGILHQIGIDNDTKFDHCLVGHLHTVSKIPLFNGGFVWTNGCLIGTNEYSIVKMKSVAKKSQLLLIIDHLGHIEFEKNITFD
jgi:hypothetical protein